ncbi:hypothetical protein SLCC85_20028 [Listeria monocytogenes]|nr:hypothetical protein SLCC85_20028 [Listeria monocytogenes]
MLTITYKKPENFGLLFKRNKAAHLLKRKWKKFSATLKQSQKIRAILFSKVLKIKLYQVWKHANIEIHFTKKGLRDMLRMKDMLEKNNQSRQKIIGISLTFLHRQPVSFQGSVR